VPPALPIVARMELVVSLLVIGAILLILETVLPGAIAGVLGVCCLVAGVVIGFVLWLRFFPESRLGRKFVSDDSVGDIRAERPELLHQTGEAFTQLRPSGTALINGRRVDVVTEGGLIERGTPIKVVAIEGMRVVVRPLPGESK